MGRLDASRQRRKLTPWARLKCYGREAAHAPFRPLLRYVGAPVKRPFSTEGYQWAAPGNCRSCAFK